MAGLPACPQLARNFKSLTGVTSAMKPSLEIGWDGGINDQNAQVLARGGVDVLNTGGFIHHAAQPAAAYQALYKQVS